MRIFANAKWLIHGLVASVDAMFYVTARMRCHDIYDGDNLDAFRREHGPTDVLLIAPPMADREGALLHPGIQILQTILRRQGNTCEAVNYNLPVAHPHKPFDHLMRLVETLDVKVVGVSLYSQAIQSTMRGLQRLKARFPHVTIVLGGPHPTEAYLSLLGLRFVDYVVRGEAEASFPALVRAILDGERPDLAALPGVCTYDREAGVVRSRPPAAAQLDGLDAERALRYHLRPGEIAQYRRFPGAHGLVGPRYWPASLVRGCPYACTYCAAHQMSGKKLRYRDVQAVVDDLAFYVEAYGQRDFSFVDDSFTEDYEFVVQLCEEIIRRGLDIRWTTDNGIRYESLGRGKRVQRFLAERRQSEPEALIRMMMRAGWRGTSIGVESGSPRVREELVRKGGLRLSNEEILTELKKLKRVAAEEGIYFYVNVYLMIGFPRFTLANGRVIEGETDAERDQTYEFTLQLRRENAADFALVSIVIPLPGTEMWDHLSLRERTSILLRAIPEDHPRAAELAALREAACAEAEAKWPETRFNTEAEALFWRRIYALPDDVQIDVHGAYDSFNADRSHQIDLERAAGAKLFETRQRLLEDFYGGLVYEWRLMRHVFRRSSSLREVLPYLAFFGRTYLPESKKRHI